MRISVVVFCCALIATSCSFLSSEPSPSDDTSVAQGPIQSEPLVQPWPHVLATVADDYVSIGAGIFDPANESGWYVAGSMNNVAERRWIPFVLHSPNGNDGQREELPLDEAIQGSVNEIYVDDSEIVVAGSVTTDTGSTATVWRKDASGWKVDRLEVPGTDSSANGISPDGSMIYGSNKVDEYNVPVAWRRDGDTWKPVDISIGDRTRTDTSLGSLVTLEDGTLLGVGWESKDSVTKPLTWTDNSGTLTAEYLNVQGVDEGYLSDVTVQSDGTLRAVGASRRQEFDSPLMLVKTPQNSTWQIADAGELQTGGRFLTGGFGFSSTAGSGDDIYIALSDSFVQEPVVSNNFGSSWEPTGLIDSAVAPKGIDNAVFSAAGNSLLIGGGSKLAIRADNRWSLVQHPELPVFVNSSAQNDIHVIDDELVVTGTNYTYTRSETEAIPTAYTWTGTKESDWESSSIGEPGFSTEDSSAKGNQLAVTTNAEESGGWAATLLTPTAEESRRQKTPNRGTINRILFSATLSLGDGSVILAGEDLPASTTEHLVRFYFAPANGPLEDAPIEGLTLSGDRQYAQCLASINEQYITFIEDELDSIQLATSNDGKSWQALPSSDTFDRFSSINDCRTTGDSVTMWGSAADGTSLVASSTDLVDWSITDIGGKDDGVYEVVELADVRMALGFVVDDVTGKEVGHIWFADGGEWKPLTNDTGPTGFEPDEFSNGTTIWNAIEYNDEIVFLGSDRNRVGLWHIPTADLVELAGR